MAMKEEKTWALPPLFREEVLVAPETGLYTSESEFVAEAIRTLLAARPDVRLSIACKLYERGSISLGKAAELSGLDIVAMKDALHRRGISRMAPESLAEIEAMTKANVNSHLGC
jgi:predicted HTH domain antitoxin